MNKETKKRMRIMLICVALLFGAIFLWKLFSKLMMLRFLASQSQVVTVSVTKVSYLEWPQEIVANGSVRAIRGVNITTELAGMVTKIYFIPGAFVKQDDVLAQLNADSDIGLLHSLEAQRELARITYERDKAQYAAHAISKQTLDSDFQNLKSLTGQVAEQTATVAKKTIRAPFTGRLGISAINPGQYLNPGDKVVTLQTLDPIYVDFYVPQQDLSLLKVGQQVSVTADTFPGKSYYGSITTIDPAVNVDTRNVEVEATVANPQYELTPGMFAYVKIIIGKPKRFLTLPQTAVSFNSYGSIVYVVGEKGKDKKGKPILIATQSFVATGDTRGDQIVILKGVKEGDTVVTSGQLKLKNGSQVAINNSVVPSNNPAPRTPDEY